VPTMKELSYCVPAAYRDRGGVRETSGTSLHRWEAISPITSAICGSNDWLYGIALAARWGPFINMELNFQRRARQQTGAAWASRHVWLLARCAWAFSIETASSRPYPDGRRGCGKQCARTRHAPHESNPPPPS